MFAIDHAATALLVKRKSPEARMVWLLISVQLMELLWVIFNYSGIETTTTEKTVESVSDIHLAYMPFSHSILSAVLLAVLGYVVGRRFSGKPVVGLAVSLGIISHLILDLITHAPDIALAPGLSQPKLGLGLYGTAPLLAFVIEIFYGIFCWWVYKGSKALLAVIVLFNLGNLSMLSSAVPGPEELLAGRPMLVVSVIAAQIIITLALVGILSRSSTVFPGRMSARGLILVLALPLLALSSSGCAIVISKAAKSLTNGSSVYATDDDPDLVWEAVPFALKTIEGFLVQSPKNKGLLLAAASGFTQYAYGHLQQDADFAEANDLTVATALRTRARKMYLRALDYGLRGLEVDFPNFRAQLRQDPQAAVSKLRKAQVPLIYWTASAWGAAIAISKDNAELTADQNLTEALMRGALRLDESWERGSIHDFFVAYEAGRSSVGGSLARAREHFERAKQLSRGTRITPLVSCAETVSVSTQNRKEFQSLLEEALAFDANQAPETRVENLIAQRRAKWLLGRIDELLIE